jgi:hypothetical protein
LFKTLIFLIFSQAAPTSGGILLCTKVPERDKIQLEDHSFASPLRAVSSRHESPSSFAVQIREEFVSKVLAGIVETEFPVNSVDGLDVFCLQFKIRLKVLLDPLRGFGLDENGMALVYAPSYSSSISMYDGRG